MVICISISVFISFFYFKSFKFEKEALSLPLSRIKVVMSTNILQIESEDVVYDFALKWDRMHYPKFGIDEKYGPHIFVSSFSFHP